MLHAGEQIRTSKPPAVREGATQDGGYAAAAADY